jgi:hypothetical protein
MIATKVKENIVEPNNNEVMIVDISETTSIAIWSGPVGWLSEM